MVGKIVFDFAAANAQAKKLEETAAGVRLLANQKIESITGQISGAWQGEASAAYLDKLRRLQAAIAQTADEIDQVAENLRYRSRKLQEAEQAASQIARTNVTGG